MAKVKLDADKLFVVSNAYTTKKVEDEREEIYIVNPVLTSGQRAALSDIQFKLNEETGLFELDYEIMNDACNFVSEIEHNDLANKDYDFKDNLDSNFGSVYTAKQLSYANITNQSEITDIAKEYEIDFAQACQVWYSRQVELAIEMIIDWIRE